MERGDIRGVLSFRNSYWNLKQEEEPPVYPFCEEEVDRVEPHRISSYHRSPFLLINILQKGRIHYCVERRDIILNENEGLIIPLDASYSFESYSTGAAYRKSVLEIRGSLLRPLSQALHLNVVSHFKITDMDEILSRFSRIEKLLKSGNARHIPELMGETYYLLHLFSAYAKPPPPLPPLLAEGIALVDNALHQPVSIAWLGEQLKVSHSTLDRLFREHLGISARNYWIRRKMLAAEYMLKNTTLLVKEIAFRLGYSSLFHFSAEFKKSSGYSPREFRKSQLEPLNISEDQLSR